MGWEGFPGTYCFDVYRWFLGLVRGNFEDFLELWRFRTDIYWTALQCSFILWMSLVLGSRYYCCSVIIRWMVWCVGVLIVCNY